MVFKPDFSFNPRPVTPGAIISRPCSPKASLDRKPHKVEDGEVSPSSKNISIMSSSPWSSKRSSMTSIASLKKQNYQNLPLAFEDELIPSPAATLIEEDDEFSEYSDEEVEVVGRIEKIEKMRIKEQGPLSINTKTSIFKGFHPFQFHSSKKRDDTPPSPVVPVARTPITPIPLTPNARATAHSRFRLFKSAPKRNKSVSRRPPPPPLNLQAPKKVSPPFSIRKVNEPVPPLEPAIVLDTSMLAPEEYDFSLSPEAGVQLLSQTLEEDCDDEFQEKEEIYRSYSYQNEEPTHREIPQLEEVTPIYLASPWFDASRGVSPMPKAIEVDTTAIKFPKTYLPIPQNIFESIPSSPIFSPLAPKDNITISVPEYKEILESSDLTTQLPSPRSTTSSFLYDEDDASSDIEDSPALVYTKRPSVPNSRKSSIATFFCRGGQNAMQARNDSIGFGGLTGDQVKIIDDAESIYYPGISSLKIKTSWLYNSPTGNYSSDEDDSDSDYGVEEEAYPRRSLPITPMHRKPSMTSSLTSTPELMLSSASSVSSYGQILSTPPRRMDRRRTASSDCMMLEALEEMEAAGLKHQSEENSKGLGLFEDFDISSEWADTLWEMDVEEQVAGWSLATPQVPLIGIAR
ncbi:uncharacterized protein H6S33_010311 [Morchella sextelata]|jgi:hypothetical protein|uniref:uncharacterized protein n=1 Tax=Morchella sextelata TaxID=1174677 RepID=UPI001D03E224|nr:uncharacterized protein H6S33_010311 [Morchella sextelata]KAH0612259.1 hypothetical protein H6S33_010311 [Morchella sextelata]